MTTRKPTASVSDSAAKFDRIRRAHQSEVAEDYVEMISDLIEETGEARTVDLAARFGVTSPTGNAIVRRLQRENLVETRPYGALMAVINQQLSNQFVSARVELNAQGNGLQLIDTSGFNSIEASGELADNLGWTAPNRNSNGVANGFNLQRAWHEVAA